MSCNLNRTKHILELPLIRCRHKFNDERSKAVLLVSCHLKLKYKRSKAVDEDRFCLKLKKKSYFF